MLRIGLLCEEKIPADSRVVLTPEQCLQLAEKYKAKVKVQSSPHRCFSDDEYRRPGIDVAGHVDDCDILLGVKEVPADKLIAGKWYFIFSHTIKKQPYNRHMFHKMISQKITLTDYERLTDKEGRRLIAFGHFAGVVGAHNGLLAFGRRTGLYTLPPLYTLNSYREVLPHYQNINLPAFKIILTGKGRVAMGARQVLMDAGIAETNSTSFLSMKFSEPVFCQIDFDEYVVHQKTGNNFDARMYFEHPEQFSSAFLPFAREADILIHGIYWDNRAPAMFSAEDMAAPGFNIRTIADITCDIAPESSIPSTLRPTTIEDPVFGYNPLTKSELPPYSESGIDMMCVDNLPNEIPRDASEAFGDMFLEYVASEIFGKESSEILDRATILKRGELTAHYAFLADYAGLNISDNR